MPLTSSAEIRLSEKVTFDVYWLGRPRRWLGSFSAVTVPLSFAAVTVAEILSNAAPAVSGLLAVSCFVVELCFTAAGLAGVPLLPASVLLQAARVAMRRAAAVMVRVCFIA